MGNTNERPLQQQIETRKRFHNKRLRECSEVCGLNSFLFISFKFTLEYNVLSGHNIKQTFKLLFLMNNPHK